MGILQSVLQTLGIEKEEEEKGISSVRSYNWNSSEESPRQWQNGNRPTRSHQMNYVTVLKDSSSLAYTSVKKEGAFVKENAPPKACRRRDEVPVVVKCSSEESPRQWQNGNRPTRSYVTVLKDSSSLAYTSVKKEGAFVKENAPPKACRRRDEVPAVVKCRVEGKWIKHYSNCQRILLVGEGDFSFSTCLAAAFGWASNMVATSLDSKDFLEKNYRRAPSNLMELSIRKCTVIHGINATEMANHGFLGRVKFDRIIFNFPFAGFFKDLPRETQLRLHRSLVNGFMENAKKMLSSDGEIHITHKTNGFHKEWQLEVVASLHRLRLVEAVDFNNVDYEGYNTKCGFGGDNNFNCDPSKTFKFRL